MFSMINRGRLDEPTQQEFEHLFARLRGFFSQSFDEDGQLIVADPNFAIVPIGGITAFAGQDAPTGYLLCDGAAVSRETYKQLFDIIGTNYGNGNGTTTFNVPDLRQRFPLGKAVIGTGATLGAAGGVIDHTHALPGHTHTIPDHAHITPNHTHPVTGPPPSMTLSLTNPPPHTHTVTVSGATDTQGFHSHSVDAHAHSIGSHAHDFSGTTGDDTTGYLNAPTTGTVPVSLNPHTHTFSGTTAAGGNGSTGETSPATTGGGSHAHGISGTGTTSAADTTVTGTATAGPISGTAGSAGSGATSAAGAGVTSDSGALTTDAKNPPFVTVNYLIYAGVFDEAALRREQQRRL